MTDEKKKKIKTPLKHTHMLMRRSMKSRRGKHKEEF
jgi:hypothetical protein